MKRYFLTGLALLAMATTTAVAQSFVSLGSGSMKWTTKSKEAKNLTNEAINHLMNVEREIAYRKLQDAIDKDTEFTVALALIANLSEGESRKVYAQKALASAENKTEAEKLFASLPDEKNTAEGRRQTWAKLHQLYPKCAVTEHFYVITRATPEERLEAALAYTKKYPEIAAMNNMLGYYYLLDKKDNETAKKYFEKYIQLYPDGTNPYDSMGEFYLLTGDMVNAEKFYMKALEKYPFNSSSIIALQKINESKKKAEEKRN